MKRCPRCESPISEWEEHAAKRLGVEACWCNGMPGSVPSNLANSVYAELCQPEIVRPVRTHDVARFVADRFHTADRSINSTLSQGDRFCWAGQALYGLARHGLIPGARSLAEVSYGVLLAAPRILHVGEICFVLEQLNYRFNHGSLLNHFHGYVRNKWDLRFQVDRHSAHVSIPMNRSSRHAYNERIHACPTHAGFDRLIHDHLRPRIEEILADRAYRLAEIADRSWHIFGDRIDFSSDPPLHTRRTLDP